MLDFGWEINRKTVKPELGQPEPWNDTFFKDLLEKQ